LSTPPALSPEDNQIISKEESTLAGILDSLEKQLKRRREKALSEELRARALTSQIVATQREEDKALLASDEAVAHGMKAIQQDESSILPKIIEQPYFARLIVEEELSNGTKEFEYRIGLRENSDCRIIDWKKAPIAKLYYEYKEGDEYSEDILGKERVGTILVKNQLDIKKSILKRISCSQGEFAKDPTSTTWHKIAEKLSSSSQDNTLPEIASLLSPEQFALIRDNLSKSLLIQGVAGSGKTSIAVHRLAWLIAGQDSTAKANRVLVLVLTKSLKSYIFETLPKLGVDGVKIYQLQDWLAFQICKLLPNYAEAHPLSSELIPRRPDTTDRRDIERLKKSRAFLSVLEQTVKANLSLSAEELYLLALQQSEKILQLDQTKLISAQLIKEALVRTQISLSQNCLDLSDDSNILRILQLKGQKFYLPDGSQDLFDHVFVDEAQDLSPVNLAMALTAAKNPNALTVVGDTAQSIDSDTDFLGWKDLKSLLGKDVDDSSLVTLKLNYRSTIQIRKLADFVRGTPSKADQNGRQGRPPIWFKCLNEDSAFETAAEWLSTALDKYPNKTTTIACKDSTNAREVYVLFKQKFGNLLRLADNKNFSFEAGIIVSEISQLRGLEFTNLLLWNPSTKNYPKDQQHRNMLYLALSRARENIAIISFDRVSEILPHSSSNLIRFYDYASQELESLNAAKA
jgi:DNA helicase-2/ATP-dependent DNA helicase PcrA